jgi:hypothetical protein
VSPSSRAAPTWTRLSAQESQIIECEAALKARNEELKYIDAERRTSLCAKEAECEKWRVVCRSPSLRARRL